MNNFMTLVGRACKLCVAGFAHAESFNKKDPSSLRSLGMTDGRGRLLGMTKQSKTAERFNMDSPV